MKSRMLISMLVIALAAAVIGGATMAWFTDSAGPEDVTFTAGTLEITVKGSGVSVDNDGNLIIDFGDVSNMAPGDLTDPVTIKVTNTGSLDIGLFRKFTASGELAKVLKPYNLVVHDWSGKWNMVKNGVVKIDSAPANMNELCNWPDQVEAPNTDGWFGIALGTEDGVNDFYNTTLQFQFDKLAGNEYQGQGAVLKIEFKATQKNEEAIKALMGEDYPWAKMIADEDRPVDEG
ncbi:MAG: hypothetical protein GX168_05195 [Bacteroidales bacterium]|nr:hypothetical protein [Bacteroidales bacterium]